MSIPSAYSLCIVLIVIYKIVTEQQKICYTFKQLNQGREHDGTNKTGPKANRSIFCYIKQILNKFPSFNTSASPSVQKVYSAILRITLYPIVPVILTILFIAIGYINNSSANTVDPNAQKNAAKLAYFFYAYSGLLNVFIFCFDPAFGKSYKSLFVSRVGLLTFLPIKNSRKSTASTLQNTSVNNNHALLKKSQTFKEKSKSPSDSFAKIHSPEINNPSTDQKTDKSLNLNIPYNSANSEKNTNLHITSKGESVNMVAIDLSVEDGKKIKNSTNIITENTSHKIDASYNVLRVGQTLETSPDSNTNSQSSLNINTIDSDNYMNDRSIDVYDESSLKNTFISTYITMKSALSNTKTSNRLWYL
ncbi:hypothetical protein BB561_001104 [Smittium simulii]|uniref:G-protein coupled receptors family 1 profile domain-containing protein n=1 Tax=Smittium simulii TaxID=133385 RepID=A0A2T9YW82_9FUNG|nr:hypothetical protein BB561_001104 [Smittium simulii]